VKLVPIPTIPELIERSAPLWEPFLQRVAKREKRPFDELAQEIRDEKTQVLFAWDEGANKPVAALGAQITEEDGKRLGVLHWVAGMNREAWLDLLPDVERYFREHLRCYSLFGAPRKGWTESLHERGYAILPHPTNTKQILVEKDLMS
jgi:hypothetical protein